ncbi:uncharacterized protein GGS25DRAFT_239203 [Hypoxylon fragiforme]|uniref:uncharacterized protein n=1 Tax=Hypoxylon fragiforme TaxID=63214 RepID=UPI0020C5D1D7|nr:uncharacterized protein GGS25DRAFT_239203 [Hypoxylon fragiforme]KAI2609922.1 hypothetical protein GGS25DRAFT_239203 [Hypoxylon fragiforme]
MAHHHAIDRKSVGSLDDNFYSAPSSRVVSRHVSLAMAPRELQETSHDTVPPPDSLISASLPGHSAPIFSGAQSPTLKSASKQRWAIPFTIRHQHNPKHHHFCPKPIGRRIHRTFHRTSDTVPLVQPIMDKLNEEFSGFTSPMISSPASPLALYTKPSHSKGAYSNPSVSIDKQGADAIVCNIRAYLSNKRHVDCSSQTGMLRMDDENKPPTLKLQKGENTRLQSHNIAGETAVDSYLVTTNDIAGILDIVIASLRHVDEGSPAVECLSMMLPKESQPRPKPKLKAIIPGSATIADPATTISSVQPSFSFAGYSGRHEQHLDSPKTTFISRQSITEVS